MKCECRIKQGGEYMCIEKCSLCKAAPDLLRECKRALEAFTVHFDPSEFAPSAADALEQQIEALEATIAEAEGK